MEGGRERGRARGSDGPRKGVGGRAVAGEGERKRQSEGWRERFLMQECRALRVSWGAQVIASQLPSVRGSHHGQGKHSLLPASCLAGA
jgi:hypothetical protein